LCQDVPVGRVDLRPLALVYHGIADVPLRRDPHGLFVAPRQFLREVGRLRKWGYELVSFGQLATLVAVGGGFGRAALTFDDGFANNVETLVPLLARAGASATVFVVSGWLGSAHPDADWARIMTADELRALHAGGIEIGAHTRTHPDLSRLSYADARTELEGSKSDLEAILGSPVEVAAYPYGSATSETIRACRDAGFRAAARASGHGSWDEPHNLPRQDMTNSLNLISLRLKRDDLYEPLVRRLPGRAARSLARRARIRLGV
jgi:peptidoglycan/xylan/chitin deacetylase (PgdA/CDA1 family)